MAQEQTSLDRTFKLAVIAFAAIALWSASADRAAAGFTVSALKAANSEKSAVATAPVKPRVLAAWVQGPVTPKNVPTQDTFAGGRVSAAVPSSVPAPRRTVQERRTMLADCFGQEPTVLAVCRFEQIRTGFFLPAPYLAGIFRPPRLNS